MKALTEPPAVYEWDGPTGVHFRDVREPSGTYYHDTTPRAVIDALEREHDSGRRVRIFLGDINTGKCWNDEYHVTGRIGRSMGPIKIPLMISSSRSHGGPAILCDCIIRILVEGREVYRHPLYKEPVIKVYHEGVYPAYPWAADLDGDVGFARFKSQRAANQWAAFMRGERMVK